MRRALVLFGILGILGIGASAQTNTAATVTLKVSGMSCGACASRVEKTAKSIDGVTGAKASQPKGVAEITFDPGKITAEAIAALITKKSGFAAEVPKK
jgi:copper chaperone CopZ